MNRRPFKSFSIYVAVCTAAHLAAVWLIGLILFNKFGFAHPPVRDLYEAGVGLGVVYLGLPDSVIGWFVNSILYGFACAALLRLLLRRHEANA